MLKKIKLYGKLAEFVGHKEFEADVTNTAQAVRFLVCNFPDVEQHMNPNYYQVKVGKFEVDKDEFHHPIGQETIHFVPVISGAGGIGKALLGAAMIGLAFVSFGTSTAFTGFAAGGGLFGGGFAAAGFGSKALLLGGGALLLGGVSQMLFPLPEAQNFKTEDDPSISFAFSNVQNVSRAGTPIPIIYGEIFTGSVVISAALDTNQVDAD